MLPLPGVSARLRRYVGTKGTIQPKVCCVHHPGARVSRCLRLAAARTKVDQNDGLDRFARPRKAQSGFHVDVRARVEGEAEDSAADGGHAYLRIESNRMESFDFLGWLIVTVRVRGGEGRMRVLTRHEQNPIVPRKRLRQETVAP